MKILKLSTSFSYFKNGCKREMINCLTKFSFHLRVISFAVSDATELLECNRVNGERVYRDTRTPHLAHMDTMLEKRSFNELTRFADRTSTGFVPVSFGLFSVPSREHLGKFYRAQHTSFQIVPNYAWPDFSPLKLKFVERISSLLFDIR